MAQLGGPRPDPGPGGRAKPKPKILKEPVPFTQADVTNKLKKTTTDREKVLKRTGDTLKAAIAIERGKAEAHPRMEKPGALGKLELSPRERGSVERTFRESLEKSAPRRGVVKPRVPTPSQGRSVAGLRKPVRKSTRRSGSGR